MNLPYKKSKLAEIDTFNLKMANRIIESKPIIETTRSLEKRFVSQRRNQIINTGDTIEVSALIDFQKRHFNHIGSNSSRR